LKLFLDNMPESLKCQYNAIDQLLGASSINDSISHVLDIVHEIVDLFLARENNRHLPFDNGIQFLAGLRALEPIVLYLLACSNSVSNMKIELK